ncbi:hypothetical protein WA538_003488 [Blastocystis sp. DL]
MRSQSFGFRENNRNSFHIRRSLQSDEPSSPIEEVNPEDEYVMEFARRCAEYPGRKPVLADIQNSLPPQQLSQLPMILKQAFEKLNCFDRNELSLSPALYHALLAGTCKRIISDYGACMDASAIQIPTISKDYKQDPQFPNYLSSLPCFRFLSTYQISQLINLFEEVSFNEQEWISCSCIIDRVLVKEDEPQDSMLLIVEGDIQKIKFSGTDAHYYSYGVLHPGSVFGEDNLVTPAYATCSLFSITSGFMLRLNQDSYMSVISLGEETTKEEVESSGVYSSLLAAKPLEAGTDALYDVHVNEADATMEVDQLLSLYGSVCHQAYQNLK